MLRKNEQLKNSSLENDELGYGRPDKSSSLEKTSCSGLLIPENVKLGNIVVLRNAHPGLRSETNPIGRVPRKTLDRVPNRSRQYDLTVVPLRDIFEDP